MYPTAIHYDDFSITKDLHDGVNKIFCLRTFQYDQCIVTLHVSVMDGAARGGKYLYISEAVLHTPSNEGKCTELTSGRCSPMYDSFSEIRRFNSRYDYQPLLREIKIVELVTILLKALDDLEWYANEYGFAITTDYSKDNVRAELFKAVRWLMKE